jgi:hypothetical protein
MLLLTLVLPGSAVAQVPDLSGLDPDTRMSIQLACAHAKVEGPAPYRDCVGRQLESIEGTGDMPDLSGLDVDTRMSIQLACALEKAEGPATYRNCVRRQLASINGIIAVPGLSELDEGLPESGEDSARDDIWELSVEGAGTPFESRWATTNPLTEESSAESELAFAGINASEGNLELYIGDPYAAAELLLSVMAGEELDCVFDNWRLAVDRQEFRIADVSRSTDNSATFLHPQDTKKFWQAFAGGSRLAVQVEKTCDGDMNTVTMVYSLVGSQAAVEFVSN